MKIVPFDQVATTQWDDLCDASTEAWLFHKSDWIEIETRHSGFSNLSFALEDDGDLIGLQPTYLSRSGVLTFFENLLHSGIHRQAGLALRDGLSLDRVALARSTAVNHTLETGCRHDVDRIHIGVQNLAPSNLVSQRNAIPFWVTDYGFHLGMMFGPGAMAPAPGLSTCAADQIVALDSNEETLFSRLDPSCRRALRKAERCTPEFEISNDVEIIGQYYEIAQRSAERTGEELPQIEYYHDIYSRLIATGRAVIAFVSLDGKRVASLMMGLHKTAGTFLSGASRAEALPLRLNDFLHWRAMLWLQSKGYQWYRLGPSFPSLPSEWPVSRVSRFKTKFGAQPVASVYSSMFRHPDKYFSAGLRVFASLCGVEVNFERESEGEVRWTIRPSTTST